MKEAKIIRRLTQKLEKEGDITLEEADWIYFCFSKGPHGIMIESDFSNPDLAEPLREWYEAVRQKILNGLRGNFIFTICLSGNFGIDYMFPARDAIKKRGNFEDLCTVLMVDKKLYSSLPFKHLLEETSMIGNNPKEKNVYRMISSRAGMYYYPIDTGTGFCTIEQVMKKFSPVTATTTIGKMGYWVLEIIFETASGARDLSLLHHPFLSLNKKEVMAYVLGDFMHRKNIPCIIATDEVHNESILFVEKDKAPVVRKVLELPFEELAKNALNKNVICKTDMKTLLNNAYALVEVVKFIEANRELVDNMVKTRMEWEAGREAVKDENIWLEEMR